MQKSNIKKNTGFTMIEILVVIAILGILASMFISSFGNAGGSEALNTTMMSTIAVLNEAKSQAVSSKSASDYGVRILNNKLISFKGDSYVTGTNFNEVTVSSLVSISTSTGIGTDIVFNNVSGNTNASGTIIITIVNDQSKNNTIRIYTTGLIEKQ